MNDFEISLTKLMEEAQSLQKEQSELEVKTKLFTDKFHGFLRQAGLPENFTLPQLALLAVQKSRELLKL